MMPTQLPSDDVRMQRKRAVEAALKDGHPADGTSSRKSAVRIAGERIDIPRGTMQSWVALENRERRAGRKHFEPIWDLQKPAKPRVKITAAMQRGEEPYPWQDWIAPPAPANTPVLDGQVEATEAVSLHAKDSNQVRRYILTGAQNNTHIHADLWANLLALADYYRAEIIVSRFTYNKGAYVRQGGVAKPGADAPADGIWYAPEIIPYVRDERVELAPGLIWCGEVQILPTAARPLSGFETYTGTASGIFPHPKIAMESIPTAKHESTKFNYTTGCVTLRNYIKAKAGLKAEHHHSYGALLVEVDPQGRWWVRQLSATSDGTIFDLDVRVDAGRVSDEHRVEAIVWGDIHEIRLDPEVREGAWGDGGMIDCLRPRYQVFHDLLDFRARNHHERGNPHKAFERFVMDEESVVAELESARTFLEQSRRPWCSGLIVNSNHDDALERFVREVDGRQDPINAEFWLAATQALYDAIRRRDTNFMLLEWAMRRLGPVVERFLRTDESFVLCPDRSGGIEVGMHGHLGPNGARGSPRAFAKMGRKAVTAHTHSAGVIDGVYVAGTSSQADLGYNTGPSAWSHSHVVVYETGKRAIVTMHGGQWRAEVKE
jgi:hypothetical protein